MSGGRRRRRAILCGCGLLLAVFGPAPATPLAAAGPFNPAFGPSNPAAGANPASASAASAKPSSVTRQPSPDVLLITIDTLRFDGLGSYGGAAATPALDELAAAGARFEHAVAHAVMTLPSHTSILTGLDPSRHGVHDNTGFRAGSDLDTWAERLGRAGYATAAFVGAFVLDSRFGLEQGFDTYDDYYGGGAGDSFHIAERSAAEVVAVARRWIRRQRGPWFAWVHVYDPHAPYAPPAPFDQDYESNPYAGEIAYVDSALAPLLADAKRRDALVVVTSDHGEALGQHGERTHGVFAYAATLRVPLLIAWPGHIDGGRVIDRRVRHIDVLPTVLEALELPLEGTEGRPLTNLLDGQQDAPEQPSYFESLNTNLARNWAPLRGLYREGWKLIDLPIVELYDSATDPYERDNLAGQRPALVDALRRELAAHLAVAPGESIAAVSEDSETSRRLRSLGYVGGTAPAPTAASFGPEDDPKTLIDLDTAVQNAVLAIEAGKVEDAMAMLGEVVEQRPDFINAHTLLATLEHIRGDTAAAIVRLQAVADAGHDTPYLLGQLAFYLREGGRLGEAAEALEAALRQQPDDVGNLTLLATVYGMSGRAAEAEATLARGIEIDPTYAPLHANEGMFLLQAGRLEEARTALERAMRYDPTLAEAHNLLGVVADKSGKPEEAVERWATAVSLDPGQYDARRNLGIALVRLNRFAEAVDVLEALFEALPPKLHREFGIAQLRVMVARIKRDQGMQ